MGYAIAAVLTKRDVHGHVSWRRGQTLNPGGGCVTVKVSSHVTDRLKLKIDKNVKTTRSITLVLVC